jgi:anti-sigma regulatory factor (Ser/Thr protein kinase)
VTDSTIPGTARRVAGIPTVAGPSGIYRPIPSEAAACVELAALPVTPYWARRLAHAVLGAWQIDPEIIEVGVLLVSELVTNAVAATAALAARDTGTDPAQVVLTLRRQPGRVMIEMYDSDPSPPVLAEASTDAETGRGLMLVQALSKEWSYSCLPSGGKVVYSVISADS